MLTHVIAILSLAGLCAGWVLFQQWLKALDPKAGETSDDCSACGGCGCTPRRKEKRHGK